MKKSEKYKEWWIEAVRKIAYAAAVAFIVTGGVAASEDASRTAANVCGLVIVASILALIAFIVVKDDVPSTANVIAASILAVIAAVSIVFAVGYGIEGRL